MSTEHDVYVTRIGEIHAHDNADKLEIVEVDGRPVVVGKGQFQPGVLAGYLPVDTLVPTGDERFAFLAKRSTNEKGQHRLRAMKLRGVFSMGLLIPAKPHWAEGDRLEVELGTEVWEPAPARNGGGELRFKTPDEPGPLAPFPLYTDVESLRKWKKVFDLNERVVATEKIHGANARYMWYGDRLWVGSRTRVKREDDNCAWWKAARAYGLAEKLKQFPGMVLYGEVYGDVQDLKYGKTGVQFVAFDAAMPSAFERGMPYYLSPDGFLELTRQLNVPSSPVLFDGRYADLDWGIANGHTILGAGANVREGFVVRPAYPRADLRLGRVIAKLVGEDYLLR